MRVRSPACSADAGGSSNQSSVYASSEQTRRKLVLAPRAPRAARRSRRRDRARRVVRVVDPEERGSPPDGRLDRVQVGEERVLLAQRQRRATSRAAKSAPRSETGYAGLGDEHESPCRPPRRRRTCANEKIASFEPSVGISSRVGVEPRRRSVAPIQPAIAARSSGRPTAAADSRWSRRARRRAPAGSARRSARAGRPSRSR